MHIPRLAVLAAGLLALASPATAQSLLDNIPKIHTPPSAGRLDLQNQFMTLDRRYQSLPPASRLRLMPQRNAIKNRLDQPGAPNALDQIEIESQINGFSQRLSRVPLRKTP